VDFMLNGRRPVFVPLLGRHVACNALAAIAVARRMGLSEQEIVGSLAEARGPDMRLQLLNIRGVSILNDAYNANPASMQAAIDTLCTLDTCGRRIAIIGDMRELGESADRFHRELGEFAASRPLDTIFCAGDKAAMIAESARHAGFPADNIIYFPNTASAANAVADYLVAGDLVLLKASRSMRFETIAQAIGARETLRAAS
jgi:UDP-N-acetylmuramoyl-tripeptide--D-alanyl-D-alanine ligase